MLRVVPPYAAMLAVMFVALSINVIRGRRSARVAIGVGNDRGLERRVRMHANFAEYVPLALLLLALADVANAPAWALHPLCALLIAGRLSHAWGLSRTPENFRFRVAGMVATFTTLLGAALLLVLSHR